MPPPPPAKVVVPGPESEPLPDTVKEAVPMVIPLFGTVISPPLTVRPGKAKLEKPDGPVPELMVRIPEEIVSAPLPLTVPPAKVRAEARVGLAPNGNEQRVFTVLVPAVLLKITDEKVVVALQVTVPEEVPLKATVPDAWVNVPEPETVKFVATDNVPDGEVNVPPLTAKVGTVMSLNPEGPVPEETVKVPAVRVSDPVPVIVPPAKVVLLERVGLFPKGKTQLEFTFRAPPV